MLIRLAHLVSIMLLASLQIVWAAWLGPYTPELVLAVVLALGLAGDQYNSCWWIGGGGWLLDSFGGSPFGFHLLSFSLLNFSLIVLSRQVFHRPTLVVAFVIFLAAALFFAAAADMIAGQLSWPILISSTLTASLAVGFYRLVTILERRREVIQLGQEA